MIQILRSGIITLTSDPGLHNGSFYEATFPVPAMGPLICGLHIIGKAPLSKIILSINKTITVIRLDTFETCELFRDPHRYAWHFDFGKSTWKGYGILDSSRFSTLDLYLKSPYEQTLSIVSERIEV